MNLILYLQEGRTSCTPCSQEHISPAGSSSPQSCIEIPNGAFCWTEMDGSGAQNRRNEDAITFEDAYLECTGDTRCIAVTCQRNQSETSAEDCFVGTSRGVVVDSGLCRFDIF